MKHVRIAIVIAAAVLSFPVGIQSILAQSQGDDRVTEGKKVMIEFSISLPETNEKIPGNIAQYVQGQKQVIPALEQALVGLKPGETKRVELTADQAFGPYDASKKTTVARNELPSGARTGTVLQNREGKPFTVVELSDNAAVVDYNHPLAGKRLVFDVKVLKVENLS